jgi:hypothetical protein
MKSVSIMELHNAPAWITHNMYKLYFEQSNSKEGQQAAAAEEFQGELEEAITGG